MKKLILIALMLAVGTLIYAQQKDPIIGKWENPSGEGRIDVYKKGDKFYGKLYWLKEPNDAQGKPKKDDKNPDASLKDRTLQGLEILTNFTKSGQTYEGGQIYDPKSGKTYSCKMTLKGKDQLSIRGFIGISLLGRTEVWKRIE